MDKSQNSSKLITSTDTAMNSASPASGKIINNHPIDNNLI